MFFGHKRKQRIVLKTSQQQQKYRQQRLSTSLQFLLIMSFLVFSPLLSKGGRRICSGSITISNGGNSLFVASFRSATPSLSAYTTTRTITTVRRQIQRSFNMNTIDVMRQQQRKRRSFRMVSTSSSTSNSISSSNDLVGNDNTHKMIRNNDVTNSDNNEEDARPIDDNRIVLDPLIVCGPSGVGKGTIIAEFMKRFDSDDDALFQFTVSHTTRPPRDGEIDGIHYHFIRNVQDMEELIRTGTYFLEFAKVHGNYYGTSWKSLLDIQQNQNLKNNKTKRALLDIDVQGVRRIKQIQKEQEEEEIEMSNINPVNVDNDTDNTEMSNDNLMSNDFIFRPKYIFIAPPSIDVLYDRLQKRGTETTETLHQRTVNAKDELQYGLTPGMFDSIIVNDNLPNAISNFNETVYQLYNITK